MKVTIGKAKKQIMPILYSGLVPMLHGSPAIGKSAIMAQIAEEQKLELIDIRLSQCDPIDMSGIPMLRDERAEFIPFNMFPLRGDKVPEGKTGFLIFFDEMNAASPAVQVASYKIILDRMVGQHHLHDKVVMVAAGNKQTDKAVVNRMSTALQSRLVHLEVEPTAKEFITWADSNGIDHRVKSFINWRPEALYVFDPNHQDLTYPSPRTWAFVSRLLGHMEKFDAEYLPVFAGAIGEGMAREFFGFTKIYTELPDIHAIQRDPEGITLPDEPSVHHALSGLVAYHMTLRNADNLIKFLKRLSIDYQVLSLRSCIARVPDIRQSEAIREWIRVNAAELV